MNVNNRPDKISAILPGLKHYQVNRLAAPAPAHPYQGANTTPNTRIAATQMTMAILQAGLAFNSVNSATGSLPQAIFRTFK